MKIFRFDSGSFNYILRQDGLIESLYDADVHQDIRVEFLEEGNYSDLSRKERQRYDFLMETGASDLYVKAASGVNKVTNRKNSGKMKLSKMFGNIQIGKLRGDQFAVAMDMSIAIRAKDGKMYTISEEGTLVDQMDFAFPMKDAFFGLPVAYNQVQGGDVIIDPKGRPLFVKEVTQAGKIKCVNPESLGETTVVQVSNIAFGTQFVTKVTSLMSMMGAQPGQSAEQAAANNPFGQINPMLFMMMNDDDENEKNLLPLIMMANQGQGGQTPFNPMMMMMMMKDSGDSDFFEMMMMSQMFGGGNANGFANPFQGLFGQPVVQQPQASFNEGEES